MIIKFKKFNNLNESKLDDINFDYVFDKKYINNVLKKSDYYKNLFEYFFESDYEDENIEDATPEMIDNIHEQIMDAIYNQFLDTLYEIENLMINDKLKIYRKMTVKDDYIEYLKNKAKHLGIYWSYKEDAAEAHWGDYSKKQVLLFSEIDNNSIDWITTLRLNSEDFSEEKEIRLYKNTRIKLLKVYFEYEEIDISDIKDKIYLA
jgi:hypothetical protein